MVTGGEESRKGVAKYSLTYEGRVQSTKKKSAENLALGSSTLYFEPFRKATKLADLQEGRHRHACTSFRDDKGAIVSFISKNIMNI